MILFSLPSNLPGLRRRVPLNARWCYLGKDVRKRNVIVSFFGEESRLFLEDRLCRAANMLREPFLDYVADIGRLQKKPFIWWTGSFASKSPFQTDFFLLLCYRALVEGLSREVSIEQCLIVFIEDSWLYEQLREEKKEDGNFQFHGKKYLLRSKIDSLLIGFIARCALFLYLIMFKTLLRALYTCFALSRGREAKKGMTGLLVFVEARAFKKDKMTFEDVYLGAAGRFLKEEGVPVLHVPYLKFSWRYMLRVARNKEPFWPLIFDLSVYRMLESLLLYWKFECAPAQRAIKEFRVDYLLQREFWKELRSVSANQMAMYYFAFNRFFARVRSCAFVYVFENQPFEKMICLAAKNSPGVKLIGYNHSFTGWHDLGHFLGRDEKDFMPLPHRIMTLGSYILKMFHEHGRYPDGILRNGGAWRYAYLWEENRDEKSSVHNGTSRPPAVLVVAPIEPNLSRILLLELKRAFLHSGDTISFLIKCHPLMPFSALGISMGDDPKFKIVYEAIDKLAPLADAVIYTASTVGAEVFVKGKKVIRFVPESYILVDPLEGLPEHLYFTCYEGNCRETILKAVRFNMPENYIEEMKHIKDEYFGKVPYDAWLEEVKCGA